MHILYELPIIIFTNHNVGVLQEVAPVKIPSLTLIYLIAKDLKGKICFISFSDASYSIVLTDSYIFIPIFFYFSHRGLFSTHVLWHLLFSHATSVLNKSFFSASLRRLPFIPHSEYSPPHNGGVSALMTGEPPNCMPWRSGYSSLIRQLLNMIPMWTVW